jgi:hypothetical protein
VVGIVYFLCLSHIVFSQCCLSVLGALFASLLEVDYRDRWRPRPLCPFCLEGALSRSGLYKLKGLSENTKKLIAAAQHAGPFSSME